MKVHCNFNAAKFISQYMYLYIVMHIKWLYKTNLTVWKLLHITFLYVHTHTHVWKTNVKFSRIKMMWVVLRKKLHVLEQDDLTSDSLNQHHNPTSLWMLCSTCTLCYYTTNYHTCYMYISQCKNTLSEVWVTKLYDEKLCHCKILHCWHKIKTNIFQPLPWIVKITFAWKRWYCMANYWNCEFPTNWELITWDVQEESTSPEDVHSPSLVKESPTHHQAAFS